MIDARWKYGGLVAGAAAVIGGVSTVVTGTDGGAPLGVAPGVVERASDAAPSSSPVADPLNVSFELPNTGDGTSSVASAADDVKFCFPRIVRTEDGCTSREALLSGEARPFDRSVATGEWRAVSLNMADPEDFAAPPEAIETCDGFIAARRKGMGAMSSADMVRESRFLEFCGLMSLARLAAPARFSRFSDDMLSQQDFSRIPETQWPALNDSFEEAPALKRSTEDPRLWQLEAPEVTARLHDIAHADFDDDGEGEILLYVTARARGGSAGFATYAIADYAAPSEVHLRPVILE